jgi:release factor glutamine methyltransferase
MSEKPPTISQALEWAAEQLRATSPTARLDAELLLAHALGWPRGRLLAEGRLLLQQPQEAAFRSLVARRVALEPVAYLVGHKEFYALDFVVDARVLVPRPETELLVEKTLERLNVGTFERLDIVDVGTGSGAIAVALAVHLPAARLVAIDISRDALDLARLNA